MIHRVQKVYVWYILSHEQLHYFCYFTRNGETDDTG